MDPGRYGHQQGWDNNSALDGNSAVHGSSYRGSGSYDERRIPDERYSRGSAFHRDENYQDASEAGVWNQSRQGYGDEYSHEREPKRREKVAYMDSYDEVDGYRERGGVDTYRDLDRFQDDYQSVEDYRDHEYSRPARFGGRDRDDYAYDDYDLRSHVSHHSREGSRERDYDYSRRSHDSDYDRGSSRRDGSWRRRESRERERDRRGSSHDRDQSPRRLHERSRSRGHDDRPRSRSPRGRSYSRSQREDSYEDGQFDRFDRWRDNDDRRQRGNYSVAPSATVVVKGLSEKTTEDDIYQMLAEWGPLRHVRVIKERNSGISRGFAFIDFPSVDAARTMMDKIGDEGLVLDGRKVFFVYSKPTSGAGGHYGQDNRMRSGQSSHRSITVPSDWMCIICGCVNFARRMSCFQCNEPRTDDAPPADMALSNGTSSGRKGLETGPTHVLVVRGLNENADEEMLRYEFSKHVPIKDLRLVRDKFTHVSRGFAFVHFHSVEDATKALEATNGMTLDKNGQVLRVAYAKSLLGPGSGASGGMQSSSLAAAAIEAAAFAQQYDAVGWAPKEYNPDDKHSAGGQEQTVEPAVNHQTDGSAPQSGFVWDEASGYYYDAASGFYYDGNTGLYYDGKNGTWYSYDNQSQQYIPCTDQNDGKKSSKESANSNSADGSHSRKAVISAPAATITSAEKAGSLSDAVQAAAEAALAAEKKEKDKAKEIRLASKSSILANKKKMNNVLTKWKQRSHEGQATRVALDDNQSSGSVDNKVLSVGSSIRSKVKVDSAFPKENPISGLGLDSAEQSSGLETPVKPRPASNNSGGSLMGVIRGSGRGVVKSDTSSMGTPGGFRSTTAAASVASASLNTDTSTVTSFRTDASALGSYSTPSVTGSGKRRFSEMPLPSSSANKEPHVTYRDRAAERRSLYGSSSGGDHLSDAGVGSSDRDSALRKGSMDSMPFPPGVGGRGSGTGDANVSAPSYEVITKEKAIDESNVGNRMLRNMGWHEGLGLGKDGSGMIEPVQAHASEHRAGLGRQQKKLDPALEVQAGDSYKTLIHKKSIARFREMSETSP